MFSFCYQFQRNCATVRTNFVNLFDFLALVLVTMITAMPEKPKKKCAEDCPFDYLPVCGGTADNNEKKSFGNECVMRKYNCEKGASKNFDILWKLEVSSSQQN